MSKLDDVSDTMGDDFSDIYLSGFPIFGRDRFSPKIHGRFAKTVLAMANKAEQTIGDYVQIRHDKRAEHGPSLGAQMLTSLGVAEFIPSGVPETIQAPQPQISEA